MPDSSKGSFSAASHRLRLMQLVSPSLPVGGYAYSRGLEYAVEAGWLTCEKETGDWVFGLLINAFGRTDIPLLKRMYAAWQADDADTVHYWNNYLFAMRESAEFQFEDSNMGKALARLLAGMEFPEAREWQFRHNSSFACLFALAAVRWRIPLEEACCGYAWSWLESQVAAAIKLVPLGQTSGQKILSEGIVFIEKALEAGLSLNDDEIGYAAPALAIGSARHETQHTRIFRS